MLILAHGRALPVTLAPASCCDTHGVQLMTEVRVSARVRSRATESLDRHYEIPAPASLTPKTPASEKPPGDVGDQRIESGAGS